MAEDKKVLNKAVENQNHAAFSMFILYLKELKSLVVEHHHTDKDNKTKADMVLYLKDGSTAYIQHKGNVKEDKQRDRVGNKRRINVAINEMKKELEDNEKLVSEAKIRVASTSGFIEYDDQLIIPGDPLGKTKDDKFYILATFLKPDDLIDWAVKEFSPSKELQDQLIELCELLLKKIHEASTTLKEVHISKQIFLETFLLISTHTLFYIPMDSLFKNKKQIIRLIEADEDCLIFNEFKTNVEKWKNGTVSSEEELVFNCLPPGEEELQSYFSSLAVRCADQFLILKGVLDEYN